MSSYPVLPSVPDDLRPEGLTEFLQNLKQGYELLVGQQASVEQLEAATVQDIHRMSWDVSAYLAGHTGSAFSITALNTAVPLVMDTPVYDAQSDYDETTGIYHITRDGIYKLQTHISLTNMDTSGGTYTMTIHAGTYLISQNYDGASFAGSSSECPCDISIDLDLLTGDEVYTTIKQTAGTAGGNTTGHLFMSGRFITDTE